MLKIIITLLLFLFFVSPASASYSSGQGPQSASATSRLTLVVLPAIEHDLVSARALDKETTLYSFSLRANTSWNISYRAYRQGAVSPTTCQSQGEIGRRNTSNDAQLFSVSCYTPSSWADRPGGREVFVYKIAGSL